MAQLSSPGVAVTVVDESFYTPAAPGTVPLVIVASEENKQNGSATGIAPGTLKANAGRVYLLTSQKDLSDTFGVPKFYTDANNNPIHAGEQNEYGLQAAYSLLGVSNRAYVVRADLDLGQLTGTANEPTSPAADGTYWFDTTDSKFGLFQWNAAAATTSGGQTFGVKSATVITDVNNLSDPEDETSRPAPSFGAIGDYALTATTSLNKLWLKKYNTGSNPTVGGFPWTPAGTWVEVGTEEWVASWPVATGTTAVANSISVTDAIVINGFSSNVDAVTPQQLVNVINTTSYDGTGTSPLCVGVSASLDASGKLNLYTDGSTVNQAITVSGSWIVAAKLVPVGTSTKTYYAPKLTMGPHTAVPAYKTFDSAPRPTGSLWVKTTNANQGADWVIKQYNDATSSWITQTVGVYATGAEALFKMDPIGGGINLSVGRTFVKYNDDESNPALANFKIYIRTGRGATKITSSVITNSTWGSATYTIGVRESQVGSATVSNETTVTWTTAGNATDDVDAFLTAFTAAFADSNLVASKSATNQIIIQHLTGGDIYFREITLDGLDGIFTAESTANYFTSPTGTGFVASLWAPTIGNSAIAPASATPPNNIAVDGKLWYNNTLSEVDMMIHNGEKWVGYLNFDHTQVGGGPTDPNGPIVAATEPTEQSDGGALANGDIWVDTSIIENYPTIHKYDYLNSKWVLVDNSDQTTENGILFRDARWNKDGISADQSLISELLTEDFVDFDCPDPALYPKGMLLWNLRRSGFNVLKFVRNYVDTTAKNIRYAGGAYPVGEGDPMTAYYPHRWISAAANNEDGSGAFGRKAVRKVVLQALEAEIQSNQQIRDEESRIFNLIACPGYPETIASLVGLNYDRGLTAFVVGDTPARLTPDATTISAWGNNSNNAVINGDDGLITTDAYLGVYYPWGFTTDLVGNNIVVPPSHMMLRTIALSDNISYPWFAPAGTRRGGITNAASVGYVDPVTGEFNSVALNTGQRDTLASVHVNPITFITGTGLVCYGQYTRQLTASALDRVNVARLVVYLRRQFSQLAKPYVFEPNDTITRNEIKQAAEGLLLELVGQRALYDFLVVCDTTNNTPARIDRSELYLDVAIEPVKAVEFIYIPLRLKNTGEIAGL
jgi:hypothetical protein